MTDQVLHGAQQPILLVPTGIGPPKHDSVQRILVPLDGSRLSEKALPLARTIASELDARILLMRVVPDEGTLRKRSPLMTHEVTTIESSEHLSIAASYRG